LGRVTTHGAPCLFEDNGDGREVREPSVVDVHEAGALGRWWRRCAGVGRAHARVAVRVLHTAMKKLRIVILGFGTARQKMVLE
jgi:hypothetical protein